MSFISKEELEREYLCGKSMFEIARDLKCSVHKVVYWMDKYNIKRRSHSEATYLKSNPDGDPFLVKNALSGSEQFIYGLGLGIYYGEGEKASKSSIRVANTNANLLRIFIKFLIEICGINRSKLSYSIVCFNDTDPKEAESYWAKQLKINEGKFGKIVQIPPQGKGSYKRKSKFGVCTVTFNNIKLKKWLMEELDNLQ